MADFRQTINSEGIPDHYKENAKKCFMCGEEVRSGGTWAGHSNDHLVSVCPDPTCISNLVHWSIDAFVAHLKTDATNKDAKEAFLNFVEYSYAKKTIVRKDK